MPSQKIFCFVFFGLMIFAVNVKSQDNLYTSYTTAEARVKLYRNLVNNSINKNLSLPLTDSTEENWQQAFNAVEILLYRNLWVDKRISIAFDSVQKRSKFFTRALLEVAYTNYPGEFTKQVKAIMAETTEPKIFAMCAEYILQQRTDSITIDAIEQLLVKKFSAAPDDPIVTMLGSHLEEIKFPSAPLIESKYFKDIFENNFLPGQIVMYSFQRKDRNYPGLVLIRGRDGKFIKDSAGNIFNVPQLARSITNLPCYLTNGNTPQGIFLMHGFDVSRSSFIGPSPNIQMSMPVEESLQKFFMDSTITDSTWTMEYYKKLLPQSFKKYFPAYQSYMAGLAGRTEIIAHGTTINPEYYKGKTYYPMTPSQGCLCTKEIWDGKRKETDQQKLVYALLKAGGANGYCVVLELDDKKQPVNINELLPILKEMESVKQ